ncbi:MAG: hypothetical protein AB7K63_07700 [Vicinamibacterales bacterium]
MAVPEVTASVRSFVTTHLRALEDLQLLVLLVQSDDRWWDAETASRELLIPLRSARAALDRLATQNLLDIRITGDVRYQFRPGTEQLRQAAVASCETYRSNPLALTTLVSGAARRGLKDFADAFRIRKDDDDAR